MRRSSALLALSLAANLAFAWLVMAPAPPATSPSPAAPLPLAPTRASSATTPGIENHSALRDRLLALGLPVDAVRAALRAQIEAPRLARLRELRATTTALPWWHGITGHRFTPEQERELRELRRTEREALTSLFGVAGTITAAETEAYLFLPPAKAARLAALERDYFELRAQLAESGPADPAAVDERKRLLEADRERDLAALLDAGERSDLDRRQSPTARTLAQRFAYFDGSESEYRALYDLQQSFHEKFPPMSNGTLILGTTDRSLATAQLAEQQQAALGPERFAAWQRTQRPDYRALVDLQRRFDLAPTTFDTMSQLPFATAAAATRIGYDPALTSAQKADAIKTLAEQTRTQVRATLGAEAGDAYLSAGGTAWLSPLDRGYSFDFSNAGVGAIRAMNNNPPR